MPKTGQEPPEPLKPNMDRLTNINASQLIADREIVAENSSPQHNHAFVVPQRVAKGRNNQPVRSPITAGTENGVTELEDVSDGITVQLSQHPAPSPTEDRTRQLFWTPSSENQTPSPSSSQTLGSAPILPTMSKIERMTAINVVKQLVQMTGQPAEFVIYALYTHSGDIGMAYEFITRPNAVTPEWNLRDDIAILTQDRDTLTRLTKERGRDEIERRLNYLSMVCNTIPQ